MPLSSMLIVDPRLLYLTRIAWGKWATITRGERFTRSARVIRWQGTMAGRAACIPGDPQTGGGLGKGER